MSEATRLNVSPGAAIATVVAVLAVGAGGTYLVMRDSAVRNDQRSSIDDASAARSPVPPPQPHGAPTPSGDPAASAPDVVVTLTQEVIDRAQIGVSRVLAQGLAEGVRLPGVVEPNAYRQVVVTPLAGGRVIRVSPQLGDRVRRGELVAEIYSPELAEARTKYISVKAMLDAHDRELERTHKLVEIGAASRQEVERIHAEHAAQTAEVESARSRLQLLGADIDGTSTANADVSATIRVPAPIDGVVTERLANVGSNVDPATKLFTIVDLANVWIIADVYERDLHRVRTGDRATVTTNASPDFSFEGRVSYIDPQLNATTRTAKVRVEVANPRGDLRLGMYTDVTITSGRNSSVVSVPKGAIQNVGDHQVVYMPVPNETAKFVERQVRIGRSSGDIVEVLSGLTVGDSIVSSGSFFIRAEAERLGLRASPAGGAVDRQPLDHSSHAVSEAQTANIAVTEAGFEPAKVSLRAGTPARLTFVRKTDNTCGTEVVFPSLKTTRALPLNEPVTIEFTPTNTGEIAFVCGMSMLNGVVVVQ